MIPRSTLLNPVSVPLGTGVRSVRLRGADGLASVRRTLDLTAEPPQGFRMDLLIGSVDRVRVLHVASTAFSACWPGVRTGGDVSVFVLPMDGALTVEAEAGVVVMSDGALALSGQEPAVLRAERPVRLLVLSIDEIGGDRMHRIEASRRLPPSPVTATARTLLRAFLADLDIDHAGQSEYLQGTLLRLGRVLGAERQQDTLGRPGPRDMVEAAVQVVLADFADSRLDPSVIAHRCRVSLRSLQRAVAEERHTTLRDLLQSVRTRNALRLVEAAGEDIPLADIARSTGFTSPDRLRRAIVTETGLSPSEYRRQLQPDGREVG
ncbi:hypothetical protein C5C31_07455 [Rathayibacter rathayi]|uniref:AraC family transcriptional regulator n=1 Tax=Rathayibacter rathayi TaxID=33887 RepID=UPI000CE811BA|nr:helix-turn-helix domain-containing protein [Rathayibacter rathayi]PPH23506.1 hypothetical protein C5C31_07455 [Rathayibacter rathayi]